MSDEVIVIKTNSTYGFSGIIFDIKKGKVCSEFKVC